MGMVSTLINLNALKTCAKLTIACNERIVEAVRHGDYEKANDRLRQTDVCKKWDTTVGPWFASAPIMPEKIFDLTQMLGNGKL